MMEKRLAIFFFLVFLSVVFVVWVSVFIPVDRHSTKPIVFVVQKGEGSNEIANNLEQKGFIRFALAFRAWVVVSGLSHGLKAGAYELTPSMNAIQIAKRLAAGDVIKEFITIPEGYNIEDIAKLFEKQEIFTKDTFIKAAKAHEGYLFPDTYQISRTQTLQNVVDQMLQNFDRHFTQNLRNETAKQRKTISQIVTMASILEKEVQTFEDKKIVAGILWKRISNGIPLQVDASPDTYKHQGLPASPISNPGMDSILSALYPTPSPYFYYLSTKAGPRGEASKTIYSVTLEEHNIAKAKYLK